jgi:outer membrane receptor protein involved in Fe transport
LFARDDQLFDTLAAASTPVSTKAAESRRSRFGFNLDHGGVNGDLKVLVNDVQQNQGTKATAKATLARLRPDAELIDDVDILNGPFSAEYGDFSGLGVVHIRLKESLPSVLTLRMQGGSFDAYHGLVMYSPRLAHRWALHQSGTLQAPHHHRKLHPPLE